MGILELLFLSILRRTRILWIHKKFLASRMEEDGSQSEGGCNDYKDGNIDENHDFRKKIESKGVMVTKEDKSNQ